MVHCCVQTSHIWKDYMERFPDKKLWAKALTWSNSSLLLKPIKCSVTHRSSVSPYDNSLLCANFAHLKDYMERFPGKKPWTKEHTWYNSSLLLKPIECSVTTDHQYLFMMVRCCVQTSHIRKDYMERFPGKSCGQRHSPDPIPACC